MTNERASNYKARAVQFLQLVVSGKIDEAYEKYVNLRGKHHNPFFAGGFPALKKAMIENHQQFPNKRLTTKHVLAEGDIVAVHSHIVVKPDEKGLSVVHIFRFENNRIEELWDCGQPIPADSPNADGAF